MRPSHSPVLTTPPPVTTPGNLLATGYSIPNVNGTFVFAGAFNSNAYYTNASTGAFIWWFPAPQTWWLSDLLGGYHSWAFGNRSPSVAGLYTPLVNCTGSVQVNAL